MKLVIVLMRIINDKSLDVVQQFDFTHHTAEARQSKQTVAAGYAGRNIEINDCSCLNADMKKDKCANFQMWILLTVHEKCSLSNPRSQAFNKVTYLKQ